LVEEGGASQEIWYSSLLLAPDVSFQVTPVEVQVVHEGRYSSADFLPLLFDAGLSGFPDLKAGTRQVTVQLP
jgi:hypothetical protein